MEKQLKVGFFGVKAWEKEAIEKEIVKLPTYGVGIFSEEVQENIEQAANYEVLSVFIYSVLDKKALDKLPKLKLIVTRSTGMDHIDLAECKKRKIEVRSVAEYGSRTVAEYAMALILAVTKKIVIAHQSVEEGEFSPEGLTGIDLYGKTLGVVGVGKIGQNVIRIARAMGMKVIAVERSPDEKLAARLGFGYRTLEELLAQADVVSLHVPYMKETHHMINKTNIRLMKPGSYLINTSRGPVVETEAIIWALNKKILAGVGLDVIEEEARVENVSVVMGDGVNKDDMKEILSFHLLRDRDDVVFTPHNAFNTKEAIGRIVATTVENILGFCK